MAEVPILHQIYAARQDQCIVERPPEELPTGPSKQSFMDFLLPMLVGVLFSSIPLAIILTLYHRNQCRTIQSITSTSTTITTTSTITTTTSTTTTTTQTTVSIRQAYVCSGKSSSTLWQLYGNDGLTMTINTSNCTFTSKPLYFTSVTGQGGQWMLTSYTAIYSSTVNSFVVYARSLSGLNSAELYNLTQIYNYDINWFGIFN